MDQRGNVHIDSRSENNITSPTTRDCEDFEEHFKIHSGDGDSMESLSDEEDEDPMEVQDLLKDLLVEG